MTEAAIDRLKRFEREEDARIAQLPITALPVVAPLSHLHGFFDRHAFGDRASRMPPDPPDIATLEAGAGRLFGAWSALERCVPSVGEGYVAEAERLRQADPEGVQLKDLLAYGHLCELMPEVHKGVWAVQSGDSHDFVLSHVDDDHARYELLDFLLLQLVSSYSVGPFYLPKELAVEVARACPGPVEACQRLTAAGRELRARYVRELASPPVLSGPAFDEAVGAGRNAFRRVQAALFALADLHVSLSNAHHAAAFRLGDAERWRALEHSSAIWPWSALVAWISQVAAVERTDVERLLIHFTLHFDGGPVRVADGFVPPLVRIGDRVVVSPALLRLFVLERNIVYAINRTDRQRFDDLLSHHLEPELLLQAKRLFDRHPHLVVRCNVDFDGGEIDLLVHDPSRNVALHMQAKAAIAPQGARMTHQVEQRALEALKQLKRFSDLPSEDRDHIIGRAIGAPVHDVRVVEAVLSRSCFGRAPVWITASEQGAALLNLGSLALLTDPSRLPHGPDLAALPTDARARLDDLADESDARWDPETVVVGSRRLQVPMLRYDLDVVGTWRRRATSASD